VSGLSEQVRCEKCGNVKFGFTSPDSFVCPYDLVINRGDVYLVNSGQTRSGERREPSDAKTHIKYLFRYMIDEFRIYVWHCSDCRSFYKRESRVYAAIVEDVGRFMNE
jgi:hypothetical protein